jgi:hypothetical protein
VQLRIVFTVAKRLGKDGYTVILNGIEDKVGAENLLLLELKLNITDLT